MTDERYKELMAQTPMPNSMSFLMALKQVANEVAQEYSARIRKLEEVLGRADTAVDSLAKQRDSALKEGRRLEQELATLRRISVHPFVLWRYLGAARKSSEGWDDSGIINILRQTLWERTCRATRLSVEKGGER